MNLSKYITKIDFNATNDKFDVSDNDEKVDEAEAVIVTIPVPQILVQLKGSITQLMGIYKLLQMQNADSFSLFFSKIPIKKSKRNLVKLNIRVDLLLVFFIRLQ